MSKGQESEEFIRLTPLGVDCLYDRTRACVAEADRLFGEAVRLREQGMEMMRLAGEQAVIVSRLSADVLTP